MADFPPTGATAGTGTSGEDRLWLESYRQANAYARDIYDNFFSLAQIAFLFNAILMAGLSVAFVERLDGPLVNLIPDLLFAIAIIGILFNVGAWFSYRGAHERWYEVHRLLMEAEDTRKGRILSIQNRIGAADSARLGKVSLITLVLFALFAIFWLGVGWYVYSRMRWDVYVFTIFM